MPMPEVKVDPEVEKAKADAKAKAEAEKKNAEMFQAKVQGGKVGRRSLISGESGGIGFYK
tara:strand:+ start:1132 stop:1311 length:180 start_codon:yes stop_codon:yes gene_type:complete